MIKIFKGPSVFRSLFRKSSQNISCQPFPADPALAPVCKYTFNRTPAQVMDSYVKAFQAKQVKIDSVIQQNFPMINETTAWQRYVQRPWDYPEVTRALSELGFENPFTFEGGVATLAAMGPVSIIKNIPVKVGLTILGQKIDLAIDNLFNRGRWRECRRAFNMLKYSYLFMATMNSMGVESGMITMAKTMGKSPKSFTCDHAKGTIL